MDKIKSILVLKEENKELALKIKEGRSELRTLKSKGEGGTLGFKKIYWKLEDLGYDFRHRHIAYCLLRGRGYEQIERSCRDDNKPNFKLVEKYKEEFFND